MPMRTLMTGGLRIAIATLCACGAIGCAPKDERGLTLREVTVSDFHRTDAPADSIHRLRESGPTMNPIVEPASKSESVADGGAAAEPSAQIRIGEAVIIDRVIGQVSGRPIFADEVLEP